MPNLAAKVVVLVVLWSMALITVYVANALGWVVISEASGDIFGIKFSAAGLAALFVVVLVLLVFLLGKIPGTSALNNAARTLMGF